jgi:hypothetical protein
MKRKILFSVFTLLIIFSSCRKDDESIVNPPANIDPTSIFAKSFGSNVSDLVTGVRQTADGGIVVCGYTIASAFGDNDIFITKLDDSGIVAWSKIIGSGGNDQAVYMDTTIDGGFIICGSTNSFFGTFDPFSMKIDNSGNIVWAKHYRWSGEDRGSYIIPTSDQGYILAGSLNSEGAGGFDVFALKLDQVGSIMWSCKSYGGAQDDYAAGIRETADGGYIIAANTLSFGNAGEILLIKLFGDGVINWSKTYGGLLSDAARDIQNVPGGFAVCGSTTSFGVGIEDGYIFSTDINGNILWSRTFSGIMGEDDRFYQMKPIPGGGIIVAGSLKNTAGNNEDYSLLRLFGDGVFNWMKTFGGTGVDAATTVSLNSNGGFILGGYSGSYSSGVNDAYILSVRSDGTFCQQDNGITPFSGNPQTEIGTPATVTTDINYETVTAIFNIADFNVSQNTHCITGP